MTQFTYSEEHRARIRKLAHNRVTAALNCVNILCPNLDSKGQRWMVEQILMLSRGESCASAPKQISDPQVTEMVWRNMQCIYHRCPMLLFGRQLAEEINEFFDPEE
jgi:hypothetical protein